MSIKVETLVNRWITSGKRKGNEYVMRAVEALAETSQPARLITLICPNFEISRRNGHKVVEIHDSLIHDEAGGLRRGYAASEEFSAVHKGLEEAGRQVNHSVIIVDNAIQWQPDGVAEIMGRVVKNLQSLAEIHLQKRGVNPDNLKVEKLSRLIPKIETCFGINLDLIWDATAQAMWEISREQNNPVGGILRRELPKETRYLKAEWGVKSDEEAHQSLIRDQYALTALVGRAIPLIHAANWGTELLPREKYVLVDAISGPQEDKHNAEYALYNLSCPALNRALADLDNSPLPIVRAMNNVALWSGRAVDAPIAGKTVEDMLKQSWEITESGMVPD